MKTVVCNVPLRSDEHKTVYPPLGALAVVQALRSAGHDAHFYDINFFRPSDERIREYFFRNRFDLIGISATVSTSYRFVRKLTAMIKSVSPQSILVVGGALTVSSEIILRLNKVDFCVIGEGEKVILDLMNYISSFGRHGCKDRLKELKGLCYLDNKDEIVFTGYPAQLPADEIEDIDYGLIKKYSRIEQYITSPFLYEQFEYDRRSFQPQRKNKKLATVVSSRGCTNRCTFCYRWQRGIRVFPVDRVIGHIRHLMEHYNVGFISFGDENFGVTKKWVEEFTQKVKPLDILYRISGICCENIDLPMLERLKQSGCVAVHYGFESGSNRMLRVIEKRADAELNVRTAQLTHQAGIQTVPTLLVGMPGESYDTISETTDFVNRITEYWPRDPIINVNVLVPLPGTPVYEYARCKGLIGRTLEDEAGYLLRVSDQSGVSLRHLNLTDYPYFIVLGWLRCICWAARYHYYKKGNFSRLPLWRLLAAGLQIIVKRRKIDKEFLRSLYGNPLFYHLRHVIAPLDIMYKTCREDKALFLKRCSELIIWPLKAFFRQDRFKEYISLRELLRENNVSEKEMDNFSPARLRLGR